MLDKFWNWLYLKDIKDVDAPTPSVREISAEKLLKEEIEKNKEICRDRLEFHKHIDNADTTSLSQTLNSYSQKGKL